MIEMGKTYRTRDNREVRIYAVDGNTGRPIHGAVRYSNKSCAWDMRTWTDDGRYIELSSSEHQFDLIEVKPKITRTYWLGHYSAGAPLVSADSREAVKRGFDTRARIAITGPHTVEFTKGEGL